MPKYLRSYLRLDVEIGKFIEYGDGPVFIQSTHDK